MGVESGKKKIVFLHRSPAKCPIILMTRDIVINQFNQKTLPSASASLTGSAAKEMNKT